MNDALDRVAQAGRRAPEMGVRGAAVPFPLRLGDTADRRHARHDALIGNAGVGTMMYDGMSGMMMVGMGILCLLVVVFLILGVAALIKYLFLGRGPDGRRKDGDAS